MSSSFEQIYAAIRVLSVPEQLRLIERVVHDVTEAEAEAKSTAPQNGAGLMAIMGGRAGADG